MSSQGYQAGGTLVVLSKSGVLIVGAGIGGLSTAQSLRAAGYGERVTLISGEVHEPYSRPPLSKQVLLGEWELGRTSLASGSSLGELGIDFVSGVRALALNSHRREVHTTAGPFRYDSLVIATGVSARHPDHTLLPEVNVLRTLEDADALRRSAFAATDAVVVGAGILGSEVAAALSKLGLTVTLVGRSKKLRLGNTGSLLSERVANLHRDNGVRLRLGAVVTGIRGNRSPEFVQLETGEVVAAQVVVFAIGSTPNTHWCEGSVPTADGVLADRNGQVSEHIYAVGDVARWAHPERVSQRLEHQQNAIEQAEIVAKTIIGHEPEARPVTPFFWSELYGHKIQAYGYFDSSESVVVAGDPSAGRFVSLVTSAGIPTGAVGWGMPREFRQARGVVDRQLAESYSTSSTSRFQ